MSAALTHWLAGHLVGDVFLIAWAGLSMLALGVGALAMRRNRK